MALVEQWEGHSEHFSIDADSSITTRNKCAWATRFTDRTAVLGKVYSDANYVLPWLVCTSCDIEPLGDPATGGGPYQAILIANYVSEKSSQPGESFTESWEFRCEAMTSGGNAGYVWEESPMDALPDKAIVLYFPEAILTLSGTRAVLPTGVIFDLLGTVNDKEWHAAPAETLLFMGPSASFTHGGDGTGKWQLSYRFGAKPHGWNKFWRRKIGGGNFERIFPPPYGTGDFTRLE